VTAGRAAIVDAPTSGIATVGITASGSTVTGGAAACIPAVFRSTNIRRLVGSWPRMIFSATV